LRKELRDPDHVTATRVAKETKEDIPTAFFKENKENRRPKNKKDQPKVSFATNVFPSRVNILSCSSDTEIGSVPFLLGEGYL